MRLCLLLLLRKALFGVLFFLSEEDRCYREGGDGAGEVGDQAADDGVAGVFDIHTAEINR